MKTRRFPAVMLAVIFLALPAHAQIVINEIMYDTPGFPDVEYVEIYNAGPEEQDLTGWYLLDDNDLHDHCLLAGTLQPGDYLAIAGNLTLFAAKYPGVTNVNVNPFDSDIPGQGFALGDGGDTVRIHSLGGIQIDTVLYNDTPPWPTEPDGGGPSLELYHPSLDNSLPCHWAASINDPPRGTPGAQNSVFTPDEPPCITDVVRDIGLPESTDVATVTAVVTDGQGLSMVELMVNTGSGFVAQLMFDDGLHGDGAAADSTFGTQVGPHPTDTLVRYYVRATDTAAQTAVEPRDAPGSYWAYTVDYEVPLLRINEMVADNVEGLQDEFGEYDDWLEIHNAGTEAVDVGGMFLANSLHQSREWELPSVVIEPGDFLLVWCDDDDEQGPLHTNFKLAASGSVIRLFDSVDHGNVVVHGFKHGVFGQDISFGYFPDDSDTPEYLATPTPAASNNSSTWFSPVCINEFQTTSAAGGADDWVEFYNRGDTLVDMSGWYLSDEVDEPLKFEFPEGTLIGSGFYRVVRECFPPQTEGCFDFGFSSTGSEVIMLSSDDGEVGQDYFDYGPQLPDITQGRLPNGTADWHFFVNPTDGNPNHCLGIPPLGLTSNLRFASPTQLIWDAAASAEAYDAVMGDLGLLVASSGDFAAALTGCVRNNASRTEAWAPATPGSGDAFFYLVRAVDFWCGFGSYDSGGAFQHAGRDLAIGASPLACP